MFMHVLIFLFHVKLCREKLRELLINSGEEKLSFDLYVKTHEELAVESSEKLLKNYEGKESEETVVFKPQNNRYQNSAESEDELDDLDLEINDLDDGKENDGIEKAKNESQLVIEESSESLFSLSIGSGKQVCEVESDEKEVNSPMPIVLNRIGKDMGGQYVQSVLNPVENLAQWNEEKAKASIPLNLQEKENINVEQGFGIPISAEHSVKLASSKICSNGKKMAGKESAVDTSLSSWLVEPENTPNSKASSNSVGNSAISQKMNSPRSHEDRPILGALTMGKLKQHSASTSPRKCRSRSPDEAPIIGTVGSYWSHTGQNIDTNSGSPSKRTPRHILVYKVTFSLVFINTFCIYIFILQVMIIFAGRETEVECHTIWSKVGESSGYRNCRSIVGLFTMRDPGR